MANKEELDDLELLSQKFDDVFNPREGELERVLTNKELIKLCEHKKCCVDLSRWNPLYVFYCKLKRRGRLENKTSHQIKKLLKRLGNHYKNDPTRTYPQNQINEERLMDWEMRKCFNVRWLDENKENEQNANDAESTIERRNSSDSCVTIIPQAKSPYDDIDVETPAVPTYMNRLIFNTAEIVGEDELIANTENFMNTKEKKKSSSLNNLYEHLSEIVGTESAPNITTQLILSSQDNSEIYENFHVSIPATSTQSQEDCSQA